MAFFTKQEAATMPGKMRNAIMQSLKERQPEWSDVHRYQFAFFWFHATGFGSAEEGRIFHATIHCIDPRGDLEAINIRVKWNMDSTESHALEWSAIAIEQFDADDCPHSRNGPFEVIETIELIPARVFRDRVKKKGKDVHIKAGYHYFAKGAGFFKADDMLARGLFHLWHCREQHRIDTGFYTPLNAAVIQACNDLIGGRIESEMRLQYPHAGKSDPNLIAYTPTPEHGYSDRQVVVKPGRYFAQWTDDEKLQQRLAECHRLGRLPMPVELQFVSNTGHGNGDSIMDLYHDAANGDCDLAACMSHSPDDYSCYPHHPLDAYGPDFSVAYICSDDDDCDLITARAIVNHVDKEYGRIYGDSVAMTAAFVDAGYKKNSYLFDGKRFYRHMASNRFTMPYTDGNSYNVYDDGEYLWLSTESSRTQFDGKSVTLVANGTQNTGGTAGCLQTCYSCDDIIGADSTDDYHGHTYCESCADNELVYVDMHSHYWPMDECVYSEPDDEWLREVDATEMTAGEWCGEWARGCNTSTLFNGDIVHDDDETVELKSGEYCLPEHIDDGDIVETIDGDFVEEAAAEFSDMLDGYVLTGVIVDDVYLPGLNRRAFGDLYYQAKIDARYHTATIQAISKTKKRGMIDWDSLAYIVTAGDLDQNFRLQTSSGNWSNLFLFADGIQGEIGDSVAPEHSQDRFAHTEPTTTATITINTIEV